MPSNKHNRSATVLQPAFARAAGASAVTFVPAAFFAREVQRDVQVERHRAYKGRPAAKPASQPAVKSAPPKPAPPPEPPQAPREAGGEKEAGK